MDYPHGDPDRPRHHHRRHGEDEDNDGDRHPPHPRREEQRYPSDDRHGAEERYSIAGSAGGGYYADEPRRGPTSHGGYASVQHVAHQVFDEGSGGYKGGGGSSYGEGESYPIAGSGWGYGSDPQYATSGYVQHTDAHRVTDERPHYATSGYVQHVDAHQVEGGGGYMGGGGGYGGRVASSGQVGGEGRVVPGRKTMRVFTRAADGFSLTVRGGEVVLAPVDGRDEYQHWIKDESYCTKVKDEEGNPSFALINKATGQAIKHSIGATEPVRLVPYNPGHLDTSILWSQSGNTGDNFCCIRMVNNIRLNFDAFHGDKDHGGVRDGTKVVLWEWLQGHNQQWKIVPY